MLPGIAWCDSALAAVEGADAAVVLTEWNEFRAINMRKMKSLMRGDVLVDLRNALRASHALDSGFRYTGIGRGQAADLMPNT